MLLPTLPPPSYARRRAATTPTAPVASGHATAVSAKSAKPE